MDAISDADVKGIVSDLRKEAAYADDVVHEGMSESSAGWTMRRAASMIEHLASRAAFWERGSMNAHMVANRLGDERDAARNALAAKDAEIKALATTVGKLNTLRSELAQEIKALRASLDECEADLASECAMRKAPK